VWSKPESGGQVEHEGYCRLNPRHRCSTQSRDRLTLQPCVCKHAHLLCQSPSANEWLRVAARRVLVRRDLDPMLQKPWVWIPRRERNRLYDGQRAVDRSNGHDYPWSVLVLLAAESVLWGHVSIENHPTLDAVDLLDLTASAIVPDSAGDELHQWVA
jgi:hypothetical protein